MHHKWPSRISLDYVILIVVSLAFFPFFASSSCDCNVGSNTSGTDVSSETTKEESSIEDMLDTQDEKSVYAPGDKVTLELGARFPGEGGRMIWYPPKGATNFKFNQPGQPEPGGPPFVFSNLTKEQFFNGFTVSYSAPPEPDDLLYQSATFSDGVTMIYQDEKAHAQLTHALETSKYDKGFNTTQEGLPPPMVKEFSSSTWEEKHWNIISFNSFSAPFTQQSCEDFVALAKSSNVFTAYRVKVSDATYLNYPNRLPIVIRERTTSPIVPTMHLMSGMLDVTLPMEVRMEETAWANTYLPPASGEVWVAMGAKPDTETECPTMGTRDDFQVLTQIRLDLSNQPSNCLNCSLTAYTCYKTDGDGIPPTSGVQPITYGNYTCAGPQGLRLTNNTANWRLMPEIKTVFVKPNDEIYTHFVLINTSSSSRTFNLSPSSTLSGVSWVIRPGDPNNPNQPDMSNTVGAQITVPGNSSEYHLHIFGTVPADTPSGQYKYTLTASNANANPTSWEIYSALIVTADGKLPNVTKAGLNLFGVASPNPASAGQPAAVQYTVINSGSTNLTDLTLTTTLPGLTSYISCQGGDACNLDGESHQVWWTLASLAPGEKWAAYLNLNVNAGVPDGTRIINNTYTVTGTANDQNLTVLGSPITFTVGIEPEPVEGLFFPFICP